MPSVALLPALALIGGALCGASFNLSPSPFAAALPLACLAACFTRHRGAPRHHLAVCAGGFALAGAALAAHARADALAPSIRAILDAAFGGFSIESLGPEGDHEPVLVRGVLVEDASPREGFVAVRLSAREVSIGGVSHAAAGGITLSVGGDRAADRTHAWRAGRIIEAPVAFRRPARYLNDGVPDFERALATGGVALFGSVKSALLVDVVSSGSALEEWAADVRARVRAAIARWVAPHDGAAAAVVVAVLIGDRTGLSDEDRERLQAAGTYHVIAISGGNIAVLSGVVLGCLMLVAIPGRVAALAGILVLLLYAQIAATGPSVWRATLMAVVYLGARLLDHRVAPWQTASIAAALMVAVWPLEVRDVGFVLTFGATAALLEAAHLARAAFRHRPRVLRWVVASLVASLATELALLPVSAQVFSRVTTAGLVLNLVAVPLMAVAQLAGLVVVAFDGAVPPVAAATGWLSAMAAGAIIDTSALVDVAPWLSGRVPPPGAPLIAAYYVSLLAVVFLRRNALRACALVTLSLSGLAIVAVFPARATGPPPDLLRLTMFDVGQGEAMLLEAPAGRMLIDAGGAPFGAGGFDIGARVLAPALWARGVRALDAMLVTHGDPDHIGGAPMLVGSFRARELWEGIVVEGHGPSQTLRELATASGARLGLRRAGESMDWAGARIRVLHPREPDWERPRVRNDDSVVLEVLYRDVAILLTGDVGASVERAIASSLTPAPWRILKVAHHGSRTSTSRELLELWRPQVALLSAGRGNAFGHPASDVLRRLESIGARIFRTDREGQITLETDGREVRVRTSVGGPP